MSNKKLLIYVVAYNAEKHISSVLDLMPYEINAEILVSDDASVDNTSKIVQKYQQTHPEKNIKLITQQKNLGYGGNQKFGYEYAIKNNFFAVALIHGDGQYSPELISQMLEPIFKNNFDAVLGSRMINKRQALKGGMPFYKFVGNIVLTKIQNVLLGVNLSEFHTGLRVYKVASLSKVPFRHNSNGFSFDTDILIQLIDNKMKIAEIAIPTHYGDEICNVVGVLYAAQIVLSVLVSRAQKLKICNCKKFDYEANFSKNF
jgi:glycosyltransferase involved in cell wall biosynthesis